MASPPIKCRFELFRFSENVSTSIISVRLSENVSMSIISIFHTDKFYSQKNMFLIVKAKFLSYKLANKIFLNIQHSIEKIV